MIEKLKSAEEATALVNEVGFLPLFHLGADGFSVEDMTPGQWWTGRDDDPWVWRRQIAQAGEVIYGKVFGGRAGFVSRQWYPVLANYRRDGYDFDSRWEEGLATPVCRAIMEVVNRDGRVMTAQIRREVGGKGFETALTLLQTQTYLIIRGFDRKRNKKGEPYGWEIAEMMTPEAAFGAEWVTGAYNEEPKVSGERIFRQVKRHLPNLDERLLRKILA